MSSLCTIRIYNLRDKLRNMNKTIEMVLTNYLDIISTIVDALHNDGMIILDFDMVTFTLKGLDCINVWVKSNL